MCIWRVDEKDRMCGYCIYSKCGMRARPEMSANDVCEKYIGILRDITGVDALEKTRKREVVWCRNIIALQMSTDGFIQEDIGSSLGKDRATIAHCIKMMINALDNPKMYKDENSIWYKFKERLVLNTLV